jgi:molecular chaperone DnaJ
MQVSACGRCRGEGNVITDPCTQCSGTGREVRRRKLAIVIPAGIESGTQIRLSGEGEPGAYGGPPGDLFVSVRVKAHPFFHRAGYDIVYSETINITDAALGSTIKVPTLEGEAEVAILRGTQTGDVIRLRGEGVPHLGNEGRRGDQLIDIVVETPKALTERQRKLLEELAESLGANVDEPSSQDKSWFDKFKDSLGSPT